MSVHFSNLFKSLGIKEVSGMVVHSDSKGIRMWLPSHGSYDVVFLLRFIHQLNFAGLSIPEVHSVSQSDGKDIVLTPVE
jgi:hypothetical protein